MVTTVFLKMDILVCSTKETSIKNYKKNSSISNSGLKYTLTAINDISIYIH